MQVLQPSETTVSGRVVVGHSWSSRTPSEGQSLALLCVRSETFGATSHPSSSLASWVWVPTSPRWLCAASWYIQVVALLLLKECNGQNNLSKDSWEGKGECRF